MTELERALEKEVTCPLCLDLFKEPKKLPCDHVYCKDCIKGLAQRSANGSITCPECRTVTNVPNDDINHFPTAFRVNRLVEAFQMAQEDTDYHGQDSQTTNCTVHKVQPLAIYCETCRSLLCRDCVIMSKEHERHKYDYIKNIAEMYKEKHTKNLQMTKGYRELLSQTHSQISEIEKTIVSEERVYLEEIDNAFELLQNTLEKSKLSLKNQLSQEYQSALETLLKDKHQIETVQAETTHVLSLVEGVLGSKNEALIMIQDEVIEKSVKKLQNQIELFRPTVDNPSLPLPEVISCSKLQKQLDTCNFLYLPPEPKNCLIDESFQRMRAEIGSSCVLTITMVDSSGKKCLGGSQKIKAELCSCRDGTSSVGEIDLVSPGTFSVTFEPQNRGRNELNVTVRGTQIANSPQSIYVHSPPSQFGQPVAQMENLEQPAGLTCPGDVMLAVEYSQNRILKFNSAFEVVGVFGHEQLLGPSELTVDKQSNVIYVSALNDKVHKFTSDGVHIKSVGISGAQRGQFNFPNGLRINSRNELYVCDSKNNRIQVFDLDLNFKRVFGGPGKDKGQFLFPSDVDFDSNDNIYVCDNYNHRIQVFTRRERFLSTIGCKRFRSRILEHPVNIRVFNELLFVTQNHQILVFKLSGELVRSFGQRVIQQPEGLEVDTDGYVYVSSHCSKVVVF